MCSAVIGWVRRLAVCVSQVLELPEEPGGVAAQLHEVHYQPALPPLPLHRGLCPAGHAALWRTVSTAFIL